MSRTITIQGTPIQFPDPGENPDWGQAVEDFAVAVEEALSGLAGAFDVSPQVMNIDAYNPTSSNVDITNLTFSITEVRGAIIQIAVYRATDSANADQITTLTIGYNANNGTGLKWEVQQEGVGDASIEFNVTDSGQVQFTTTALAGSSHTGIISYYAKALLNS